MADYYQGDTVFFSGTGLDNEDDDVPMIWHSSIDGQLNTSTSFSSSSLSIGIHTITLTATDNLDATDTDQISLTILTNSAPVAAINRCFDG